MTTKIFKMSLNYTKIFNLSHTVEIKRLKSYKWFKIVWCINYKNNYKKRNAKSKLVNTNKILKQFREKSEIKAYTTTVSNEIYQKLPF